MQRELNESEWIKKIAMHAKKFQMKVMFVIILFRSISLYRMYND